MYIGEKLSKQELQSNNIIKKLRAKEKQTDQVITSQKLERERGRENGREGGGGVKYVHVENVLLF